MIDEELLQILVCPESKKPVTQADDALVARINKAIAEGRLVNRAGQKVESGIDGGLVREGGDLLYPIRDDIPIMLIDEAKKLD